MSNRILMIAVAAALVVSVLATGSAMAVRGGNSNGNNGGNGGGGNYSGTIDVAATGVGIASDDLSWGDDVIFMVDASVKERDLYKLWVTTKCSMDGAGVYTEHKPVRDGVAGPFTLGLESWEGTGECTAWVWVFDSSKTVSGAVMTYSVGS